MAALLTWLPALGLCELMAGEIAAFPQPDQALWVLIYRLLPLAPLAAAAIYAALALLRRIGSREIELRSMQIVLIGNLLLFFVSTPKPN